MPVNFLHRFLPACCTIRKGKPVPKRQDLDKILLIGSGPIVIGQACEFDYSGTQACKALKEEGYTVVLVNNNPATIMTDPELADRTYLEPLTPVILEKIIRRERPQALLPTMGGQTALNLAVALAESGVLARYGVELIGAKLEAIKKAEDRDLFKQVMQNIGLVVPRSVCISDLAEAPKVLEQLGLPLIIRPPSPSAVRVAVWPTMCRNSRSLSPGVWRPVRTIRCLSRSRCSGGKSTNSRSCATSPTTW